MGTDAHILDLRSFVNKFPFSIRYCSLDTSTWSFHDPCVCEDSLGPVIALNIVFVRLLRRSVSQPEILHKNQVTYWRSYVYCEDLEGEDIHIHPTSPNTILTWPSYELFKIVQLLLIWRSISEPKIRHKNQVILILQSCVLQSSRSLEKSWPSHELWRLYVYYSDLEWEDTQTHLTSPKISPHVTELWGIEGRSFITKIWKAGETLNWTFEMLSPYSISNSP